MTNQIHLFQDKDGNKRTFNWIQEKIFRDKSRNKVIVLHRRCGKTSYGCAKCLISILQNTHHKYWLVAPTYRQAKMIAWDMIKYMTSQFPKGTFKLREDELSVTCVQTQSKLELKGSDNPDSLRGAGLNGLILDEFQDQHPEVYTKICRPMLSTTQGWLDMIGTPKGKNAFYDYYMKALTGDYGPSWKSYLVKASTSGIILPDELEQIRREITEDEYNQEYQCDFLSYAGLIYKEFSEDHNIVKPFKVPKDWDYIFGMDHGASNPTVMLRGRIDTNGNVFMTGEYYKANEIVSNHVKNIKKQKLMPSLDMVVIGDPHMQDKIFQSPKRPAAYSVADEYGDYGITNIARGQNAVHAGINRVAEHMKFDPERIHPFTGKRGAPKLFIVKGACPKLEWEISNYKWKDQMSLKADAPDQPCKINDHAVDALRYMIMSRFSETAIPTEPEDRSVKGIVQRHIQRMKNVDYFGDSVPPGVRERALQGNDGFVDEEFLDDDDFV